MKRRDKPYSPTRAFMPAILQRLAPRLGAEVLLEPEHQIVGRIRFPNGRQSYFWHNKFNLNSVASAKICQDKGHTSFFLDQCGFRVPRGDVFLRDSFRDLIRQGKSEADARCFAEHLGWSVYLKPLRKSQGDGIIKACGPEEFDAAAKVIFQQERSVLVQEACAGRDYRIVVLDGEVICAYERTPLQVCGDGDATISTLLTRLQEQFIADGRDTIIPVEDQRIAMTLHRQGLNLESVLPAGSSMQLMDVANLSCGGTTRVITEEIHPSVAVLAAEVSQALDLRLSGVDLLAADATRPLGDYAVLEVNSAPGLDHYGASGPEHEAHVDELYLKVLEAIERGPLT